MQELINFVANSIQINSLPWVIILIVITVAGLIDQLVETKK